MCRGNDVHRFTSGTLLLANARKPSATMGGSHSRSFPGPGEEVNFDHFQILRAIGKGSFGKVCIVEKRGKSGQMYAMKYVRKTECVERGALRNVLREVEILSKLEHPFLANLWFSFQDEEDLFMVSDLLLGGDLRYHIQKKVHFSESSIILFIAEIGLALDYLRSKRIVHRDLKPDNILLDEEGHAHVTDFNVATTLEENQLATSVSGTRPYIAPEIFMCTCGSSGVFGYDYSVDWWSLGVLAWETLEGVRPFHVLAHTTHSEALRIMQDGRPMPPSNWSKTTVDLLESLLTFDPKNRLTTLEALQKTDAMLAFDFDEILKKQVKPVFTPSKDHLNCDPTFELEEMIIETRPLHKKKKRLAKQRSLRCQEITEQTDSSLSNGIDSIKLAFIPEYLIYNREREIERREREMKEAEWEEELRRAMAHAETKLRETDVDRHRINRLSLRSRLEYVSSRKNKQNEQAHSLDIDYIDVTPESSTS
ncbi:serine/threonine-protein kinase 32A [Fopius arisanus]|uniref:Serine/threonine-protein kinase 32A n=1 Tax=Fopius arisanus TaxID=64838 RepID=A0A0C9RFF1_9HYME|nr:PREDICTED: serine/threonine-protein kinase 32A [Fopius arisanus]